MTKLFRKLCAAMVLSFLCAAPAIAAPITLNITWSGQSFQNNASATGVIKLEDFLLVANGGISTEAFAISAIEVAVDDGMGGMTYFNRTDFFTLQFQDVDQLDVRREWIGQTLANGCLFGTSRGDCGDGQGGDFNLFGIPPSPGGSWFFEMTLAGGKQMLVTSIVGVPEPASVALFGLAVAGLVAVRRRRQAV